MNNELTEVVLVVDRSGSMSIIKDDMQGGIWSLVQEQHGQPGRCNVSLYTFDSQFEVAFEGKPAGDISANDCRISPRGSTALFDATVRALGRVEARVLDMPEDERPGKIVIVVITDGAENASQEVRNVEQVKSTVARVTSKYSWQFVFMAANLEGFAQGRAMTRGAATGTASLGSYRPTPAAARASVVRVSSAIAGYRSGVTRGVVLDDNE